MESFSIWVRVFNPEDYINIETRPEEHIELTIPQRWAIANRLVRGPAYTIHSNLGIVVCFGALRLHPGVGEAWAISSPLIKKYPITAHAVVKKYLRGGIIGLGLHRVQALVNARFEQSLRWMEALGFSEEGVLHDYGPDKQDFILFAWVKSLDGDYPGIYRAKPGRKRRIAGAGVPARPAPVY